MKKMGQLIGSLNAIKMLVFYGCRNVPRDSGEVYLVHQEDKIALCREMYDLSKETPLGLW